ncbi:MAG TPA: Uma2 family endonuclease, partial [Chloroflexota bacterium]|nr:Uma2 family endonuclease [Chloroflexota bacterium]
MAVAHKLLTASEFEAMIVAGEFADTDHWLELVNGEVVELPAPPLIHSLVVALIIRALSSFADRIGALLLVETAAFVVGPQRQQVRQPDASLITRERASIAQLNRRFATEAPDLAVEVLSAEQHTEAYAVTKVAEYLGANGKVVWLVDTDDRTVRVYETGKAEYTVYSAMDTITLDA